MFSFIDKIKVAKKAAEDHQKIAHERQQKEQDQESKPTNAPYKHIPTHAYQDALMCMGQADADEMRDQIREQHRKRRSEMMDSAMNSRSDLSLRSSHSGRSSLRQAMLPTQMNNTAEAGPSNYRSAPATVAVPMSEDLTTTLHDGPTVQTDRSPTEQDDKLLKPSASAPFRSTSKKNQRVYFSHSNPTRRRSPLALPPTESELALLYLRFGLAKQSVGSVTETNEDQESGPVSVLSSRTSVSSSKYSRMSLSIMDSQENSTEE